jgi:hypothetical protein
MFYLLILLSVSAFLMVFAVFFTIQFYNMVFRGFAPYISSNQKLVNAIFDSLVNIKDGSNFYELGAGKAGFLRGAEKKFSNCHFFGVEYSFLPYFTTKMQLSLVKSKIQIKKQNIFATDLKDADVIYCYLNIKMMADLEKKFIAECKPGTTIISNAFQLPNKTAERVLDIDKNNKVYFYKI